MLLCQAACRKRLLAGVSGVLLVGDQGGEDGVGQLPLDAADLMQIFVTLFYMFGTKIGAIKYRTGIE